MTTNVPAVIAKKLAKIYYTPSHPAAFSTVDKLYLATGKKIKRKVIIDWLASQDTYTLHKPMRKNFRRNCYTLTNIGDLWECDLAVFSESYSEHNNGIKYLLG